MLTRKFRENTVSILVGALSMLMLFLLTGAGSQPSAGKYQMEAVVRDKMTQVYVMDTTTGVVKWVDDMNTPFEQLKGD